MPAAPSLLIVPYRSKTGKLYSQIPTSGAGDFTVTRNTEARRFNSAGLIESVASGIPRLDYYTSGGTAGCPALLVEPAATNLALQSEAWNVSPWTATSGSQGATVSGNVTTSPDGTTNADKLIEAAVTGTHFCLQSITLTSGTTYTASFFVKASERTRGRLRMSGSGAYWDLDFNLTSGTVTGGTNPFIQNFGNGWFRIGATFTANQASNNFILFILDASGNASYTGIGTNGIFVWGAQLETGSVATSYIPTAAASGSRSADVVSVSGAVSGAIGQTEGTLYMEVDIRNMAKETYLIRIDEGAASNILSLRTLTSNVVRTAITAPTTSGTINISSAAFTAGIVKIAFAYKSGEIALSVNGATALTANGTFAFGASLNRITLGSNASASSEFNDRIRAVALYTTRLTNAELAALTA